MNVSVVCTTLNEEESIRELFDALSLQTRQPDEVIMVDGGSTDDTIALAGSYRERMPSVRIMLAPGTNISEGRNRGIAAARSSVIALTDAGCIPDPRWLEAMAEQLNNGPKPALVSGIAVPKAVTHLEWCIAQCSLSFRINLGTASFLPTARAMAFHRDLWSMVGGFPEDMDYGEDAAFVLAVRDYGGFIRIAEDAKIAWRPRKTYRSVVKQFFHYADGLARGGLSGVFHRRTIAYDLGGILCIALGLLWNHPLPWSLLGLLVAVYGVRKVKDGCFSVPTWRTSYRVPLVLLAIHAGTLGGILHGNVARLMSAKKSRASVS
jgi:glycosyltransferase involved in cell wall biosynthesis